jgi:hypothetical protein
LTYHLRCGSLWSVGGFAQDEQQNLQDTLVKSKNEEGNDAKASLLQSLTEDSDEGQANAENFKIAAAVLVVTVSAIRVLSAYMSGVG